jgi:hypothetical protein
VYFACFAVSKTPGFFHPSVHLVHPVKNRLIHEGGSFPVIAAKSFKNPSKTTFLGSFPFCIPYSRKMCMPLVASVASFPTSTITLQVAFSKNVICAHQRNLQSAFHLGISVAKYIVSTIGTKKL